MANWGNIFYGAAKGVDAFSQQRLQRRALEQGAGLFAELGTPEAQGYAELMQNDPDAAAIFAREFGGLGGLYNSMRQNALYGVARQANVAAGRVLGPEYEEAAAYGADPIEVAKARKAAAEAAQTPATMAAQLLQQYDIDPADWTGGSIDEFLADAEANGEPDFGLLVPRPKPSSRSGGTAPKPGAIPGYQAVQTGVDERGNPTYRYTPVPGAPANARDELNEEELAVMKQADAHPEWLDESNPAFNTPQAKLFRARYWRALKIKNARDQSAALRSYYGTTTGKADE